MFGCGDGVRWSTAHQLDLLLCLDTLQMCSDSRHYLVYLFLMGHTFKTTKKKEKKMDEWIVHFSDDDCILYGVSSMIIKADTRQEAINKTPIKYEIIGCWEYV